MPLSTYKDSKGFPESRPLLEKIILNCLLPHFSKKLSEIILFKENTFIFAIGMFMEYCLDKTDKYSCYLCYETLTKVTFQGILQKLLPDDPHEDISDLGARGTSSPLRNEMLLPLRW